MESNNIQSQDDVNNQPQNGAPDEIYLLELVAKLWAKRGFILKVTGLFLLLGLFVALFSPVKYTASCVVVPQGGKNQPSGGLGGMAAMMGLSMDASSSGEVLSPAVYPQILKSVPFTREIMRTPITVAKSNGSTITLYEYYTDKQYQSFNLISSIKKHTLGLPGLLIGTIRGESDDKSLSTQVDSVALLSMTREEEEVYKTIQETMQLSINQKEGYITLDYSFPEAGAAARITEQIRKTLEKYVTAFKIEKVEDNLAFVEMGYNEAKQDFLKKQENLASFQDANRGLTSAIARTTEDRLRNEYSLAFTVYSELAKQREQAKLEVKETKPILTTINPVVVPTQRSAPRRGLILIGFGFLGFVAGIGWVFFSPFLKEIKAEISDDNKD